MTDKTVAIAGVEVPRFLYGTAWKENETKRLTELALQAGFRGIDTANQRRHYHEAAVGEAIAATIASQLVTRDELFLQTKFTFRHGQDHRLPYDPEAPVGIQVQQSLNRSLKHLRVDQIDSFLLHGPSSSYGIRHDDTAAWEAMEAIHDAGQVRMLGISNVTLEQLEQLCQQARIRPAVVQNRCFAVTGWDRQVRQFCADHEILYQGFSLLTANRDLLASQELAQIAEHHGRTIAQIVFRFALDIGIIALTGTSKPEHMQMDLDVFNFHLDAGEIEQIRDHVTDGPEPAS